MAGAYVWTFDDFRNNVFCRRESNQKQADKLWVLFKIKVPAKEREEFETEWNHYILGEHSSDDFAYYFDKIKQYFKD